MTKLLMQYDGNWWIVKKASGSPFALGLGMSLSYAARELGLPVPEVTILSGDSVGVRVVPDAKDLHQVTEDIYFDYPVLAKMILFDWCVGNCNVRRQSDGNLIRDANNAPCYSERHDKNMLWDPNGKKVWFLDFDHAFAHHLWLFGAVAPTFDQKLEDVIPEHEAGVHSTYRFSVMNIIRNKRDLLKEEIQHVRDVLLTSNFFAPPGLLFVAQEIFDKRVEFMRDHLEFGE